MSKEKIRFGLIGSGWRAEFYIRIAKALPELFQLSAVLIRDREKGCIFAEKFQVRVVNSLEELNATQPEFVVLAIKRGMVSDYLITLFKKGIPVLSETPPAEDEESLRNLWKAWGLYQGKIQVAEQYFLQPLYASWYKTITDGRLGEVENINISSLHGYHGVGMIRKFLDTGFENCKIYGKRYWFNVTETYGREGMAFDGEVVRCSRDRVTMEFDSGKVAFFDFSDPAQYHSFIRTRQLSVQGTRGEIDDLTIRYLTEENIPVTQELRRIDLGVYSNQEWSHYAIMLGEEFLYRTPFINARFNDDEIAVASCLVKMHEYVAEGKEFYGLADALQDMYLCLKMEEALNRPVSVVETVTQPWAENME
ncbi:MAG: Gfo/Idh/MocA family oxidoreductase [Eubacteriales bacterium]|nr:Gfo/Idh/MocA family oxidoreductase [Eubacteriales bacterium]